MQNETIRVRFAPSPTGHLHLGGARTALFNWLFARSQGGIFILRIEDTDIARSSKENSLRIINSLKFLGLDWDEGPETGGDHGPYFQFERKEIYGAFIKKLLQEDKAYHCYCLPEELKSCRNEIIKKGFRTGYDKRCRSLTEHQKKEFKKNGRKPAVRFKVFPGETSFTDLIRGKITFNNEELDDFIILKSTDLIPTYNFAAVVDDSLMEITHILRGDDHISNTPRQILLYRALNLKLPCFGHLPMILGKDNTRLSKRHHAVSVDEYQNQGYLPDALINYLARLGWSYNEKQEFFSRRELIEKFSINKVGKNPAVFDQEKLLWLNSEHIKKLPLKEKTEAVIPFLQKSNLIPENIEENNIPRITKIVETVGERLKLPGDIVDYADFFFKETIDYTESVLTTLKKYNISKGILIEIKDTLKHLNPFTEENIENSIRSFAEKKNLKLKEIIQPIRIILTGKTATPGLFESIAILEKDITIKRISDFLANYNRIFDGNS